VDRIGDRRLMLHDIVHVPRPESHAPASPTGSVGAAAAGQLTDVHLR
jgi:hypothetical protein